VPITPNIALQRTPSASPPSPLSFGTLGRRKSLPVWLVPILLIAAACATEVDQSRIAAYRTGNGAWHRGGKGVTLPKPIELIAPSFPPELRRAENVGQVVLEIEVSAEGRVENPKVVRSVSPASDAEAVRTVLRWKYEPARLNGEPVAVRKQACVNFRMRQ
jgi:TonB family protein